MQESIVATFARVAIVCACAVSQHVGSCKTVQTEFLLFPGRQPTHLRTGDTDG